MKTSTIYTALILLLIAGLVIWAIGIVAYAIIVGACLAAMLVACLIEKI